MIGRRIEFAYDQLSIHSCCLAIVPCSHMWFWDINFPLVIMLLCVFILFPIGLIWSWLLWREYKQKNAVQKIAICILYYAVSLGISFVIAWWLLYMSENFPILRYSFSTMNEWYTLDPVSILALLIGFTSGYRITRKVARPLPGIVWTMIVFVFLSAALVLAYAAIHTECQQELEMLKYPSTFCGLFKR